MVNLLVGGVAIASLVVGLFFLRFWVSTKDTFFLLFALSFWIDGAHRIVIQGLSGDDPASPAHYLPRLLAYALILVAIVQKNRRG